MSEATRQRLLESMRAANNMSKNRLKERLDQLKERKGLSKADAKGFAYSSIHSYVNKDDHVTPSVEFLQAAAEVLGRRAAWLAFGEGEPTVEQQEHVQGKRGPEQAIPVRRQVHEAFGETFPPYSRLNLMYQFSLWGLWMFLRRSQFRWSWAAELEAVGPLHADVDMDDPRADPASRDLPSQVECARMVGKALAAPLEAMNIDPDRVEELELHRYVQVACQALLFLVDQEELAGSLWPARHARLDPSGGSVPTPD